MVNQLSRALTLINQGSVSQQDACGKFDLLSDIANDLKERAPAVNDQIAKIVQGLLRGKQTDEVLVVTQNCYNTPENCECFTNTRVNRPISDKLKSDTRSADIKLHIDPIASVIEKFVKARDKIPKDALDAAINKSSH